MHTHHKFDQQGNSQIFNARFEQGQWRRVQTTDWHFLVTAQTDGYDRALQIHYGLSGMGELEWRWHQQRQLGRG